MTRCEAIRAFREVASEEFSHIPTEVKYEFSDKFNRKMEKLLKKVEYNSTHFLSKPQKRILAFIAVTVMIFAGLLSVGAVRKAVVEFAAEAFDNGIFYELEEDAAEEIECEYFADN